MHPTTHLLLGWAVANSANLERRERAVVTLAGVLPDADALGVLAGKDWFSEYHHVITHNIGVALLAGLAVLVFSRRRFTAAALALLSFHLHLVGDLLGSRGPDGYQWPIPYLLPFSDAWQLAWDGQWALNAWPNVAITIALLSLTLYWAWKRGFSPMEIVSRTLDQAVVVALRRRFGTP